MITLERCTLLRLSPEACAQLLDWVLGEGPPPDDAGNPRWLLAHCDDGVVWGHRRTPDGSWALSSAAFPDVSPPLRAGTLQELRVFGFDEERLVWRADGALAGRRLRDAPNGQAAGTEPINDVRIVRGEHVPGDPERGFTVIVDRAGSRHAVPVDCWEQDFDKGQRARLVLRHYLEQDSKTGAVRIAATRLVDLELERG
ncbi:MAG: type III-D CRISPR-associated protein Csx19 [Egibacteraceae bacterium]